MLSAGEVPRIAGTFGLDTTTRANIMSAVYTAQAAVNTTRSLVQAAQPDNTSSIMLAFTASSLLGFVNSFLR